MRVKVAELDVRQLQRIEGLASYDAVEILFRNGRDPIGRARIPCDGDSVDPEKLRPLINNLPSISTLDPPDETLPTVTVAICTWKRPEGLSTALRSLAHQESPADEILVIDNGCQDEIQELVESILPHARYVRERRQGLNFARNRALSETTCDIIAFLDDDAEADSHWVRSIVECFAVFGAAGAVTGLILALELETEAQELFEANGGFARGFLRRVLPRDHSSLFGLQTPLVAEVLDVGSGCNMAFRTTVLKQLEGFDEALDTGPPLPGGGDFDMFYRVMRVGYELVYEPRALVRHCHRRSNEGLKAQLTGHHRALTAFLVKTLSAERGLSLFGVLLVLLWRLIKPGYRLIRRLMGQDVLPFSFLFRIFFASLAGLGSYQASKGRIRELTRHYVGTPPKITGQLSELWRYRGLVWNLTVRDLKVKYQRSWLGFLWTLLNPLITVGVLIAVFSYVIKIPIRNYWAFLISGFFVFNFFSLTLNGGVQAAVGNAYLTRSTYFPQEVLLLSSTLARFLEFLGELAIIMLILVVFHHHRVPPAFIMAVPLVFILFLLAIGLSFPIATLAVYYRDTVQVVPLVTMVLFYASPVFYSLDFVPQSIRTIYLLNPIASLLSLCHKVLYRGEIPGPIIFLALAGVAVILFVMGYIIFNWKKREFAEIV